MAELDGAAQTVEDSSLFFENTKNAAGHEQSEGVVGYGISVFVPKVETTDFCRRGRAESCCESSEERTGSQSDVACLSLQRTAGNWEDNGSSIDRQRSELQRGSYFYSM